MESLLSEGFALHTRCSAAAILRPATRVTFFGGSFAPLSRPLMRRRSIHLSPATTGRISALARNGSLISKSMQEITGGLGDKLASLVTHSGESLNISSEHFLSQVLGAERGDALSEASLEDKSFKSFVREIF
ncbi:hypothetical protein MA16_Dca023405 [Dendrobium catenatum]|uniref:Uncharacterized protein n=1 Tax=Dendrobium catenatum TaxID=906689 RepID=A0A2I0XAH3_9ASPA|nr:hypothetical protein MA16_Dca023405 [Dendrobium catenatum]